VARLETFVGRIPGMSYGDILDFGTRTQKKRDILLFGVFVLKIATIIIVKGEAQVYLCNEFGK
jgi:hypothetical protein